MPSKLSRDIEYHREYRRIERAKRDRHIDRWLKHGMTPDEIKFACGYSLGTIYARVALQAR